MITVLVNGEDNAKLELQETQRHSIQFYRVLTQMYAESKKKSGEWDTLLAIDSLSHSFDQSYKLNNKTSAWTRPTSLLDVVPQVGE